MTDSHYASITCSESVVAIISKVSIGRSYWNTGWRFEIIVYNSADSKFFSYDTRVHYISLEVITCMVYPDGRFEKKTDFKSGEIITFIVSIKDKDMNQPIPDIDTIQLRFTGTDKTAKLLTPTNDKGETSISIPSPKISSLGWTYQAYYPGNSVYTKAYSNIGSYSTNEQPVPKREKISQN